MADPRAILNRWRCRRLSARLVDVADGGRDARVDAHVASCRRCAEALAALREVPGALRRAAATHDDAFWQRQRHDIMRAIRAQSPPAPRHAPRPAFAWRGAMASVAAAVLAVAGYRLLPRGGTLLSPPSAQHEAPSVDDLDSDTMAALSETVTALAPQTELMTAGRETDEAMTADLVGSGWFGTPTTPDVVAANDLDDDELDHLDELIGDRAG